MLDETDDLYAKFEKVVYAVNSVPAHGGSIRKSVAYLMAMSDSVARVVSIVIDVPSKFLELIEKFLGELTRCPGCRVLGCTCMAPHRSCAVPRAGARRWARGMRGGGAEQCGSMLQPYGPTVAACTRAFSRVRGGSLRARDCSPLGLAR